MGVGGLHLIGAPGGAPIFVKPNEVAFGQP
jgi:hypothetical protein